MEALQANLAILRNWRSQFPNNNAVVKRLGEKVGISNITALIIQSREDIVVTHAGPNKTTGKYSGWITLGPDDYCRPLLNTEPEFETPELAEKHMHELIAELRAV